MVYDFWLPSDPLQPPIYYYAYIFNCKIKLYYGYIFLIYISTLAVAMCLVYLAIFSTSDAFVCSIIVAVAERCKLLVRMAPVALVPGKRGEVTPMFKAWIKYHQQYEL